VQAIIMLILPQTRIICHLYFLPWWQ